MTIAASCQGMFSESESWSLSISSARTGQLVVDGDGEYQVYEIEIGEAAYDRLARTIRQYDLFSLPKQTYGDAVASGSSCHMSVTIDQRATAITLLYLRSREDLERLQDSESLREFDEARRAALVFSAIRDCFASDDAHDPRKNWQFLEADPIFP